MKKKEKQNKNIIKNSFRFFNFKKSESPPSKF